MNKKCTIEKELKRLIGKRVVAVVDNSIKFEDGIEIEFHPYETYVTNIYRKERKK